MLKPLYAIMIDGGYLTKILARRHRRTVTADDIVSECERLQQLSEVANYELLRIYYYDAYPAAASVKRPVSGEVMSLGDSERFRHAQSLFDALVLKPNIALRMGRVDISPQKWKLKSAVAAQLVAAQRPLTDDDFVLDMNQKGVDMRIGMDMARLALRQMVRAVIVITGDSDFVPAFKYVRREGVKVILDPMGGGGRRELREHSDLVLPPPPKLAAQAEAQTEARTAE